MTTFRCRDNLKRSSGGHFEIESFGLALAEGQRRRPGIAGFGYSTLDRRLTSLHRRSLSRRPSFVERRQDTLGPSLAASHVPAPALPEELRLAIPNPQRRAGFDRNHNCVPRPVEDRRIRSRDHGASNGTARWECLSQRRQRNIGKGGSRRALPPFPISRRRAVFSSLPRVTGLSMPTGFP